LSQRCKDPFLGIKDLIGDNRVHITAGTKGIGSVKIRRLSRGQMPPPGVAQRLAGGVDLCGQAPFAVPEGFLRRGPPLAPPRC
jgi:hypothetical protein